ncbi:hypothetical protein TNCV_4618471 [Trichonephila clavipes]|nr:hypothetical protein TNCV_4618471 [Trichonephila clavipes]
MPDPVYLITTNPLVTNPSMTTIFFLSPSPFCLSVCELNLISGYAPLQEDSCFMERILSSYGNRGVTRECQAEILFLRSVEGLTPASSRHAAITS